MRSPKSKYEDLVWPKTKYPPYVSGGGLVMNRAAVQVLRNAIPKNPVIPIDDAFVGICLKSARYANAFIEYGRTILTHFKCEI